MSFETVVGFSNISAFTNTNWKLSSEKISIKTKITSLIIVDIGRSKQWQWLFKNAN